VSSVLCLTVLALTVGSAGRAGVLSFQSSRDIATVRSAGANALICSPVAHGKSA
jgi:hypothetical protein